MDHYQDVRVLPDPEFSEPTLLSALFAKLHRALAAYGKGDIGISFPQMQRMPGAILRLHGSHEALTALGIRLDERVTGLYRPIAHPGCAC